MTPEEVRHAEAPDAEHCSCVPHLRAEIERLRDNAEARERVMRCASDLLRAAQREVDELRAVYAALRQTSADLCVVCGWRFYVPDVGCQGCERARLEAENERLRELLDAKSHEAGLYARRMEQAQRSRDEARAEKRAAVVAWLREQCSEVLEQTPQQTAKLIERGEHRREEE